MFCPKCGVENSDDAKVCSSCGTVLKREIFKEVDAKIGLVNGFIDKGVEIAGKLPWGKWIEIGDQYASRYGIAAFYLYGILAVLCGIIGGIRSECFVEGLKLGFISLFTAILAGYVGSKLLGNIKDLVTKNESKFANPGLMNCFTLVMALLTLGCVIYGITSAIDFRSFTIFLYFLGGAVILAFATICLLAPELICVKSGVQCTPTEELIALLTIFVKILMRLVPFIWIFGALYGVYQMVIGIHQIFTLYVFGSVMMFIAFLPLIAYLLYLIYNYLFDICRAILSIPAKLDELKK